VMRLLSGENGYVRADQSMQDRLKEELASQHPDLGAFRDYAETRISLVPGAVQKIGVSIPAQNAGGYSVGALATSGTGGNGANEGTSFSVPALSTMERAEGCRFCGGTLPQGRPVIYCPHCGQNLAVKRCEGCGSELDPVWKFCVNCGKKS
jgi:hypothetical protein